MNAAPQVARFSLLDFGPDPIFSDPFDLTIKGKQVTAVLAEISQREKDRLRIQAIMEVQMERQSAEEKAGSVFGDWTAEFFETCVTNTWISLMLQRSLRDAEDPKQCLVDRSVFELIPSGIITDVAQRFEQFEAGLSPATVTQEKIQDFIEAVKKNLPPSALWRRFGTSTLWGSLLFLVEQLSTCQIAPSSDT